MSESDYLEDLTKVILENKLSRVKYSVGGPSGAVAHDLEDSSIRIDYAESSPLKITLCRTLRGPDNVLPATIEGGFGDVPLYKVFPWSKLPAETVKQGGVLHQSTAFWLKFDSARPYAVKIYADDRNILSGEPRIEDTSTLDRRQAALEDGRSIQDYIVTGPRLQNRLDGEIDLDGKFKQFIARPRSLEASGHAVLPNEQVLRPYGVMAVYSNRVLRFEVTPVSKQMINISITHAFGSIIFSIEMFDKMEVLMDYYRDFLQKDPRQLRYFFKGNLIKKDDFPATLGMEEGSSVLVASLPLPRLTEGELLGIPPTAPQAERVIHRDPVPTAMWDTEQSVVFNIHLINDAVFYLVTGNHLPSTPVTPAMYDFHGIRPSYPMDMGQMITNEHRQSNGDFTEYACLRDDDSFKHPGLYGHNRRVASEYSTDHSAGCYCDDRIIQAQSLASFVPVTQMEKRIKCREQMLSTDCRFPVVVSPSSSARSESTGFRTQLSIRE